MMPQYIIKLEDKYLLWSTIVDAPVNGPWTKEELYEYFRLMYGENGITALEERMARVEAKGTSAFADKSVDETISCNYAGPGGTVYTKEQIIRAYVHGEDVGPGKEFKPEDEESE